MCMTINFMILQTAIDSLRDEYILKQEDLQREKLHCGELERDVVTLRKDLKSSQLNVSSLQNEVKLNVKEVKFKFIVQWNL